MGLLHHANRDPESSKDLLVTPIWGQGWPNLGVVGESHYGDEIRALLPRDLSWNGEEATVDVLLVREPHNTFDKNAIAVQAAKKTVGYLPKPEAARYAPVLDVLMADGRVAQTTARVWGRLEEEGDRGHNGKTFFGSVQIALPAPHLLFPMNEPPAEPHVLLPVGSAIQVSGEENYRDNLLPWINSHGEAWVHATLHAVDEATARTSKRVAEVQIGNRPVGRLSPKMSQNMLPVVDYLAERGLVTCVPAIVKGNALKSDVVLHTVRAGELTSDWLAALDHRPTAVSGSEKSTNLDAPAEAGEMGQTVAESTPPPDLPPAEWYPDPYAVSRLRYWDGTQWTEHTAD